MWKRISILTLLFVSVETLATTTLDEAFENAARSERNNEYVYRCDIDEDNQNGTCHSDNDEVPLSCGLVAGGVVECDEIPIIWNRFTLSPIMILLYFT